MRLQSGLRLGPYEVLGPLGAGGMAEVYRARDTRLARDVALKMVTEALSSDPDLIRRFEQEARLAGSLNHPNLVAVYDVGLHEGAPYFVTELLKGESLRARLARGRVPLSTALDWATQMARGLAAAHVRGIVHRDVKPDNVFVCSDGQVKLLDFGIAKLAVPVALDGAHDLMVATVTPTGGATRTGSVLGTPGYMSPEQLRGEPLDARSDIFSWAATIYETLAGHRAFPGATLVESGYSILHKDPEALPPEVPVPVAEVVIRCLDKDPARRIHLASDLVFALEVVGHATGRTALQVPPSKQWGQPRRLALLAVASALLLVSTVALVRGRRGASPAAPEFEQVTFRPGFISSARFLQDGRTAFSAAFEDNPEQIFVRPSRSTEVQEIGLSDARLMTGVARAELAVLLHPQLSVLRTARGTLAQVPSVGGAPRALAEDVEYADWSSRGELLLVRFAKSRRTLESPPGNVLFSAKGWISHPRYSHSGQHIAFLHHPLSGDDMGEVVVLDREGRNKTLSRRWYITSGLAWSPDDAEVWFTGGQNAQNTLRAVNLSGNERVVYSAPSFIELQDISASGEVLLVASLPRVDLQYSPKSARGRPLSFTDWNPSVGAVSDFGQVLFGAVDPVATDELMQPMLSALRGIDGSSPQVLGHGYPLDLSADGRWALVQSEDEKQLSALPTGPGQAHVFDLHGLNIRCARFLPGNGALVAVGRTQSEDAARLYVLDGEKNTVHPVSEVRLGAERGVLHLSPDATVATALTSEHQLALIALADGTSLPIPAGLVDMIPRGWSSEGQLWLSQGGKSAPARLRLLRVEFRTGRLLEERTISPPEIAGTTTLGDLQISRSGEHVVFYYRRSLGRLLIARGLWHAE